MNTTPRLRTRKNGRVSFQLPVNAEKDFVTKNAGTFSITVKSDKKDEPNIYENENEPFEYDSVESIHNALRYFGAVLNDSSIEFINEALSGSEETGKAVRKIVDIINSKLKADAKSNAYQSIVNEKKPLAGEKLESAQARLVRDFMRAAKVSKESAIETLRMGNALPSTYTVADFDSFKSKKDSDD